MPLLWGRETTGIHLLHTVRPSAATNRRVRPHHSAMLPRHCECGEPQLAVFKWCSRCVMFNMSNRPSSIRRPTAPSRAAPASVACQCCDHACRVSKRFCFDCIVAMGAPRDDYHSEFNNRSSIPAGTSRSARLILNTRHDLVHHRSRTACQIFQRTCRNSYAKRLGLSPPENRMTSRTRYRHIAAIHGSLHPGRSDEQQRQPRNLDMHQKRR